MQMNADASLLTRLAVNLLGNAIRYGRRGGHAWLKLTDEADGVCLAVRDDGVGMSPEEPGAHVGPFLACRQLAKFGGNGSGIGDRPVDYRPARRDCPGAERARKGHGNPGGFSPKINFEFSFFFHLALLYSDRAQESTQKGANER